MSAKAVVSMTCNYTSVCLWLVLLRTSYLSICHGTSTQNEEISADHNTTLPETALPLGSVQGISMVTRKNRTVSGFVGIPYAQPPIGDLRFKAPEPVTAWNETLNASRVTDPILCPQFDNGSLEGDEDCLYLNVYTPQLPTTDNSTLLPVMMFIIGGAFVTEKNVAMRFGPEYILDEDVILVVPNYRVGILGFFSTGDEASPGNYGLKDIVQALKWTKEYIQYFGGDPNQVTLFGQSSGAMSVQLLALSESTSGLFHKIITQSGSALCNQFSLPREVYAYRATKLGIHLGCPTNTSTDLVNCLRDMKVPEIADASSVLYAWKTFPNSWAPTSEPDTEEALFTDMPANLIAAGKMPDIPWIALVTWDEGLAQTIPYYEDSDLLDGLFEEIDVALPAVLDYKDTGVNESAYTAALMSYYLNDLSANRTLLLSNMTQMFGDALFLYPMYNAFQQQLLYAKSSQYFGAFKYRGAFSKSYLLSGGSEYTGVPHSDDCLYLFPYYDSVFAPPGTEMTDDDYKIVNTMVQLWTSFAIAGTPTTAESDIIWEPYTSRNNYLRIGNVTDTTLDMEYDLFIERMRFWKELTSPSSAF